jgi:hypothetical protein
MQPWEWRGGQGFVLFTELNQQEGENTRPIL